MKNCKSLTPEKLSVLLGLTEEELLAPWLANNLYDVAKDEPVVIKAMEAAQKELIKKSKRKKK